MRLWFQRLCALGLLKIILRINTVLKNHFVIELRAVYGARVGELWANPELSRRQSMLFRENGQRVLFIYFLYMPYAREPANKSLYTFWRTHLRFVPLLISFGLTDIIKKNPAIEKKIASYGFLDADGSPQTSWRGNLPILLSGPKNKQVGPYFAKKIAKDLLVKTIRRPWVMLHIRDRAYLETKYPEIDFLHHSYRDSDIRIFYPSIRYLLSQGYSVVRSGRLAIEAMQLKHQNLHDFPFARNFSENMENYLWSNCAFSISTGSGPDLATWVCGIPSLAVEVLPPQRDDLWPFTTVFLRHLYHTFSGDSLPREKYHDGSLRNFYKTQDYERANLSIKAATSTDILSMVTEFELAYKKFGNLLNLSPQPTQRCYPWF